MATAYIFHVVQMRKLRHKGFSKLLEVTYQQVGELGFVFLFFCNLFFYYYLLILERERKGGRERENKQFVIPLIYAFLSCFLYVP